MTVALNLLRNQKATTSRRASLLQVYRPEVERTSTPTPAEIHESASTDLRVQAALRTLTDRERELLLLHAEGYRYREIATALDLNETSIGVFLARARRAFQKAYEGDAHARE